MPIKRDFTAGGPNLKWVGDITEIPTAGGKLYLATVIDLYSRRLLGAATGLHPDADPACRAIQMVVVAARGGADQTRGDGQSVTSIVVSTPVKPRAIPVV